MLDAAGGGGGGTDWSSMTVEMMQALAQNPKTDQYYELLTGWVQSYQLVAEHMSQVQSYRNSLAEVWPPEKNAASAVYIARLDDLLTSLNETYEAALANHDAFAAATLSIGLAQPQMQKIYDEYSSNQQVLLDYTTTKQQSSSTPSPSPSPSASGDEPPVAPGRQEELRQRAATLMSGLSSDLVQAQVKIVTPTLYEPGLGIEDKNTSNGGSTYTAPPIPPITPTPIAASSAISSSTRPSVTFPTNAGTTTPVTTVPGTGQPGLVLGGTTPPVITTPSTGIGPISPTLPSGAPGPISTPGILPPLPGGGSFPPTNTGVGRVVGFPNEGVIRPGTIPEGMRAMPPGGVIGGTPGAGLGQPGATRPGARRVNPVGGVIGEGEAGARGGVRGTSGLGAEGMLGGGRGGSGRGTAAPGRGMSAGERTGGMSGRGEQPFGQAGNRRGARRDETDDTYWDPENPWETEEGVDPVVLPPREQRVDPGPAIGLN